VSVLIIDWTGEGGIAEATRSWYSQARVVGRRCTVITTLGRALSGSDVIGLDAGTGMAGYSHQVGLVQLAEQFVRKHAPRVVVVQGYVMPHEEQRVVTACRSVGARLVQIVYTPRPAFLTRGSSIGLRKLLRSANVLVTHTDFVASRLKPGPRQRLERIPFPPFDAANAVLGSPPPETSADHPAFGAFARGPVSFVADADVGAGAEAAAVADSLAGDERWTVAVPAPPDARRPLVAERAWMDAVTSARGVLVPSRNPYGNLMTSVAVASGVVPVVANAPVLLHQIGNGRAGIAVPANPTPKDWVSACERLLDDAEFLELSLGGNEVVAEQRAEFTAAATNLLG
jgi:hypothetical protein